MKNKTSKFLLCENPMIEGAPVFLLHTRKPRFLARVDYIELSNLPAKAAADGEILTYLNPDGLLEVYHLHIFDKIDPEETKGALTRMGDWYIAYLKWEDQQISQQGGHLLRDHNANTPGLKLCYSPQAGWVVIYAGVAERFATEPEMDHYLTTQLGFSEENLQEGYINHFFNQE
jgi:hypothetical protein